MVVDWLTTDLFCGKKNSSTLGKRPPSVVFNGKVSENLNDDGIIEKSGAFICARRLGISARTCRKSILCNLRHQQNTCKPAWTLTRTNAIRLREINACIYLEMLFFFCPEQSAVFGHSFKLVKAFSRWGFHVTFYRPLKELETSNNDDTHIEIKMLKWGQIGRHKLQGCPLQNRFRIAWSCTSAFPLLVKIFTTQTSWVCKDVRFFLTVTNPSSPTKNKPQDDFPKRHITAKPKRNERILKPSKLLITFPTEHYWSSKADMIVTCITVQSECFIQAADEKFQHQVVGMLPSRC